MTLSCCAPRCGASFRISLVDATLANAALANAGFAAGALADLAT